MTCFAAEDKYVAGILNIQDNNNAYKTAVGTLGARLVAPRIWDAEFARTEWFLFPSIPPPNRRLAGTIARTCAVPPQNCIRFAQALLANPVSGSRLRQAYTALKPHIQVPISDILGEDGADRFLSFLTLFEHASLGFPEHTSDLSDLRRAFFGDKTCAHTHTAIIEYEFTDSESSDSEASDDPPILSKSHRNVLRVIRQQQRSTGTCAGLAPPTSSTGPFTELPTNHLWYNCMFPIVGLHPPTTAHTHTRHNVCALPPSHCIAIATCFLMDPDTGGAFLTVCKNFAAYAQKNSWPEIEDSPSWLPHREHVLACLTFFEQISYGHEHWPYVCDLLVLLFGDERCPATSALLVALEFGDEETNGGLCELVSEMCVTQAIETESAQ